MPRRCLIQSVRRSWEDMVVLLVAVGGTLVWMNWKCGQSCTVSRPYGWPVIHPPREGEGDGFGITGGYVEGNDIVN